MRKLYSISWTRALFIAALPGIGVWWMIRQKPSPDDRPFTRKPRIMEIVPSVLGTGMLVAGLFADVKILIFGAAFLGYVYGPRLLGRLFLPRRMVDTEREFLALTMLSFPSHMLVYFLLVLAIYSEQWLMGAILAAFIIGATILGAFLLRLMAHGLVDEFGSPIYARPGRGNEGTMTTATRWPLA